MELARPTVPDSLGLSNTSSMDNTTIAQADGQLMTPEGYIATAVVLFFIGFVGFFSNLSVIVLMCKNKQLWTPLNLILFNLVCSDFSVSIFGNPVTFTAALLRGWSFGRTACIAYGFFMSLLGIAAITTLMVVSFERYVMISKPFHSRQLTSQGAVLMILAIWGYALAVTMPPIFGWGQYINEAANISCSVNWEHQTPNATSYIIFLFTMGLVIPMFVICFSYFNIIWTMKRNALSMGRVTKAESRVTGMVAAMVITFLVAWTPYSIFALIVAFGDPNYFSPGMAVLPALMAKSSICYNPIIYVGLNTQFRVAWRQLLGRGAVSETSLEVAGEHTALSPPVSHTEGFTSDAPKWSTLAQWRSLPPERTLKAMEILKKVQLQVNHNGSDFELKTLKVSDSENYNTITNPTNNLSTKQEHSL